MARSLIPALLLTLVVAGCASDKVEDTGEQRLLDDTAVTGTDDTGTLPDVDVDEDGYVDIDAGGDDCDDEDASVNPGAIEAPYNGVDDDCDGGTPDDDLDGDSFPLAEDCDDQDALQHPGVDETPYDGVDNDCDPATPDDDLDVDGYGLDEDCDDGDSAAYPGAVEIADDGIDQDCDGEDLSGTWTLDDLSAGDLVITEVMVWPSEVEWTYGQWIEITNVSGHEVDLQGLPITGYDRFEIAASQIVADGGRLVVGGSTSKGLNGGAAVDISWGSAWIIGEGEGLRLTLGEDSDVIDRVQLNDSRDWEWGASISLEPTLTDATDNDNPSSWCASASVFGWAGMLGTPGGANDSCPIDGDGDGYDDRDDCDDADAGVHPGAADIWDDGVDQNCDGLSDYDQDGDSYEASDYGGDDCDDEDRRVRPDALDVPGDGVDGDCDGADAEGDPMLDIDDLVAGDLVISELMPYPSVGEENAWVEIYNALDEDVYLDGLTVRTEWDSYTIWDTLVIPAEGYAVLGGNDDFLSNGGVPVDHEVSDFWFGELYGAFTLATDAVAVDEVYFDDRFYELEFWTYASLTVNPDGLDADSNDDVSGWCLGSTPYGDGDLGTPGTANICPADDDEDGFDTVDDCDDTDSSVYPGAYDAWYDGVDADCAGDSDYDQDGDGADSDAYGGLDCDDEDRSTRPDALDIPGDGIDNDCDGADAEGDTVLTMDDLSAGDLVISEVMLWGGVNPEAWWFEVHNPLAYDVYLDGLIVSTSFGDEEVWATLVVEAGGYVVFSSVADPDENGGVPVDHQLNEIWLGEGDGRDMDIIVSSESVTVDRAPFDYSSFPWDVGVSTSLSPSALDADDNDDSGSWCLSTSTFGDGDLGTPGDANDGC